MSATIVRFAPSPTGRIHIGNVRTAILNWLFAKKAGGTFLLRMDDTDRERSTEAFAASIREDLTWLGLTWAREEKQSDRSARYTAVAEKLKASGHLYPCYETEDELDRRRSRQRARNMPPLYDRQSLRLTAAEHAQFQAEGRKPHWRFRLANSTAADPLTPVPTNVVWEDLVRGTQTVDAGSLSDPVLIRADGTCLYTFTSVVDDIDFAVTHVIRGEDHVTNTGVQVQIFEALGGPVPAFGHFSLLVGVGGEALSKRLGSLTIAGLRDDGIEPMAVNCHAALIGTSDAVQPFVQLEDLAGTFDLGKLSRSPSRFDIDELVGLNAKLLHKLDYAAVETKLADLGVGGGAQFWDTVRGNLVRLSDARLWWDVVSADIAPVIEDKPFCATAAALLPPAPWTAETWGTWTNAVKTATGAKGRALFHPLRLALTGRETGPDMKSLLLLIGREQAMKRLS
jgi:glutamyl-tRNA synthetase